MWYVPISMKLPAFRCEHFWIMIWRLCWVYLGIFFGVQNITSDLPTSILIMDMISNWQLQFWYFQMIGIWLRYEDCPFPKHRLNLFIEVLENLKRSWWVHLLFRLSEMLTWGLVYQIFRLYVLFEKLNVRNNQAFLVLSMCMSANSLVVCCIQVQYINHFLRSPLVSYPVLCCIGITTPCSLVLPSNESEVT